MRKGNKVTRRREDQVISYFAVLGLNGGSDLVCRFEESKLIIVGENGLGKTTVLSLLYYTLTKQWIKIRRFNFSAIRLEFKGETIFFEKSELFNKDRDMPYRLEIESYISENNLEDFIDDTNPNMHRDIARSLNIPSMYVRRYVEEASNLSLSQNLIGIDKYLSENVDFQILYLPTFRRIEQDLRYIYPEIAYRISENSLKRKEINKNYLELVEFGMGDVEKLIQDELNRLREEFRSSLLDLTNTFLAGILQKNYSNEDMPDMEPQLYEMLLKRYSKELERTLKVSGLEEMIEGMKTKKAKSDYDKIVQYFWNQLLNVYLGQYIQSRSIIRFVETIDSYLVDKVAVFDPQEYKLGIYPSTGQKNQNQDPLFSLYNPEDLSSPISLRLLSSGEKQIMSLFAHLHLSDMGRVFVIIDEPELSLSIKWQKRFLVDIVNMPRVIGLFSVTHSPFIFDNNLRKFTHDFQEFAIKGQS